MINESDADTGISNCDFGQLLAHRGIGLIDPLYLPQVDPFERRISRGVLLVARVPSRYSYPFLDKEEPCGF
jgi:hypothetical protein